VIDVAGCDEPSRRELSLKVLKSDHNYRYVVHGSAIEGVFDDVLYADADLLVHIQHGGRIFQVAFFVDVAYTHPDQFRNLLICKFIENPITAHHDKIAILSLRAIDLKGSDLRRRHHHPRVASQLGHLSLRVPNGPTHR
jgi:hypothetical protein